MLDKWKETLMLGAGVLLSGITLAIAVSRFRDRKKPKSLKDMVYRVLPNSIVKVPTKEEKVTEQEITFLISIKDKTWKKPKKGETKTNPFLYPFEPGINIANLGQNYRLLYNKYPISEYHTLIVTKKFERQSSPLKKEDLEVMYDTMLELRCFAFYNSGPASGYSQEHKHIQLIPYQSVPEIPIEHIVSEYLQNAPFTLPNYQFKHLLHGFTEKSQVFPVFNKLLALLNPSHSYNLVVTERWMLLVSREKDKGFDKFDLNALGYAGMIVLQSEDDLEFLKKIGPLTVLRDAAVKA